MIKKIPNYPSLAYVGADVSLGKLKALIYFSLSAEESLTLDPYNQPVQFISGNDLRVFSFTLPFHGPHFNKAHAMQAWSDEIKNNPEFLFHFIKECSLVVDALIKENVIDPHFLSVAGLSRGAFLATHLGSENKHIKNILGFAPLTSLSYLEEFQGNPQGENYNLVHLNPKLIHKNLRFYIGNHDTRVGTENCFQFINELSKLSHEHAVRSPKIELIISPSVGHKGHGTASKTFQDGVNWLHTLTK